MLVWGVLYTREQTCKIGEEKIGIQHQEVGGGRRS